MVDGRANIDLIFRNGLKDYEVSPPELWCEIEPAIGRKKKRLLFVKYAAVIAAFVSVSAIAYTLGYRASKEPVIMVATNDVPAAPFDITRSAALVPVEPASTASTAYPAVVPVVASEKREEQPVIIPVAATEEIPDAISVTDYDVVDMANIAEAESFPKIQEPVSTTDNVVILPERQYQPIIYEDVYTTDADVDENRWSILAMASPMYYSQFTTSGSDDMARQIKSSDQNISSYSGGVGFAYKISDRLSIQSGVHYSAMGQELGEVTAYNGFAQINPSKGGNNFKVLTPNGTVYANNPDVYLVSNTIPDRVNTKYTPEVIDPVKKNLNHLSNSLVQDFSYFELPVLLRYKVIDKKVGVSFVGGMSYNFLINNSVSAVTNGKKYSVGTTEGMNGLSLSSSLGMGMEYNFSRSLSFNLEPTFRYFLNSSNSDRMSGMHNYAIGLFSGMSYKF